MCIFVEFINGFGVWKDKGVQIFYRNCNASFEEEKNMRKLLSYAKSHIYEIHALLVATFVVVLMSFIKEPIKRKIAHSVDKKIQSRPELMQKRRIMVKRKNVLLIVLTMLLSFAVFTLASLISPLIEFSFSTAVMSGVFALCEYAFIDQITFNIRDEDE